MAQDRVLRELQGMQWPKTGFYEDCRVRMAQNRVLEEMQGVQWPKTGF